MTFTTCCKFWSLLAISLLALSAQAQPATGKTPDALVRSGEEQIEKGQYYRALEQFEKAYKEAKEKDIAVRIARTHLLLRDYNKASIWFGRVLRTDRANKYVEDRFWLGMALKMNENYTEAAEAFRKYLETGQDENRLRLAERELEGIDQIGRAHV